MDDRERAMLEDALGLLEYPAGMDHWCEYDDCAIDNPQCPDMHLRAAVEKLQAIADPEMKTLHPSRMTNSAERIYVEEWAKLNERSPGINHGFTTLEHILDPAIETHRDKNEIPPNRRPAPPRPSQRDAEVATTLIQWLGTNCGKCFVDLCERRIESERIERSDWWRSYPFLGTSPVGLAARTAKRIVEDNVAAAELRDSVKERLTRAIAIHLQALLAIYAIRIGVASAQKATELMGYGGDWHIEKTQQLQDKVVAECHAQFGQKSETVETQLG